METRQGAFLCSCAAALLPALTVCSSAEINSGVLCCQAPDLEVLSPAGHVLSHDETCSVGSGIDGAVRPADPLHNLPRLLARPVKMVTCHIEPRHHTRHLHSLSRSFHLRGGLVHAGSTTNSCKRQSDERYLIRL